MEKAEFLKFLLRTGTSDNDLIQAGFKKSTIRDAKKGNRPVSPGLQYFVTNRFHEMMNEQNSK